MPALQPSSQARPMGHSRRPPSWATGIVIHHRVELPLIQWPQRIPWSEQNKWGEQNMYSVYTMTRSVTTTRYTFAETSHLFGCQVGRVPRMLAESLSRDDNEPKRWHVPIGSVLEAQNQAFIIELKPNNRDRQGDLSLYELRDVWGLSANGWTPFLLRMRPLCVDGQPPLADMRSFEIASSNGNDFVHTFLHFAGTIRAGKLEGKWTAPRSSSTNSVLLWPEALEYFVECVNA